ncbi:testis-expressed protein 36 isoform X2 [Pseudophryne corroboree]|uniref:testis-expressed protein 36 isoform X2 n=1 Tax=Pseudophryne corroboree TaxID=495146 RepID=UPI003081EC5B
MPKGRSYNPPTERQGIWFPHIDVRNNLLLTSTQEMYRQAKTASWKEPRLPHNEFQDYPFSAHDNRHVIQSTGEYLDSGLGRKKTPAERRQHTSQNLNLSNLETPQRATNEWAAYTNYQVSHKGRQDTERPFCRRYPNHHYTLSTYRRDLPENHFMWFADYRAMPH